MSTRELVLGDAYGPVVFDCSAQVVTDLLGVVHEPSPPTVGGREVAPTGLLAIAALHLIEEQHVVPPRSVHAEEEIDQVAPLLVGTQLQLTGSVTDLRERKGRVWLTVEGEARDEAGALIATTRTMVVLPPAGSDPTGSGA